MAQILNDSQIKTLIGTVIINGSEDCLRPNSYITRLGIVGEFLNTSKEFELGKTKKGIKIQPGHSVALTSRETLDFRRETVQKMFPNCDLHAFLSPTTDLSREGIVAPTTQVDAGYHGTLNWTLTNTSSEERKFVYGEKLFRLTIFKLESGEKPDNLYKGDYQDMTGYIRSKRKGAPVGMKESEWIDSNIAGGPEELLDNLLKSGYPWHLLGQRLKVIDQQFRSVTEEYASINESIEKLSGDVDSIRKFQGDITNNLAQTVKDTLRDEATILQNRWLLGAGSILIALIGLILSITSNESVFTFLKNNGAWLGILLLIIGVLVFFFLPRKLKK